MATHSSILAWRIPYTEMLGRLPSIGSHRVWHDWSEWACTHYACKLNKQGDNMQPCHSFPILNQPAVPCLILTVVSWSAYKFLSLVQSLHHVLLFATPRTAAHQASLSITNSWSLLKLMSIESVMPSNHLILCCALLLSSFDVQVQLPWGMWDLFQPRIQSMSTVPAGRFLTTLDHQDTCSLEEKLWQNLDSILKSRDITLLTKVLLVKTMVFPVVMYGCESWTIKKAAC